MTGYPNQSINRKGEEVKEEGVTEVYTPKDPVNIDPKGPDMVDTTIRETVPMAIAEEEAEWDTPMDWVYLGHKEWSPPEEHNLHKEGIELDREPEWIYKWRCHNDEGIRLHQQVM